MKKIRKEKKISFGFINQHKPARIVKLFIILLSILSILTIYLQVQPSFRNFSELVITNLNKQPESQSPLEQFSEISNKLPNHIPIDVVSHYYSKIGAESMIKVIEEDKYCHNKGHNVGKVIYWDKMDLGAALQTCSDSCTSGCFHGVLMAFFKEKGSATGEDEHLEIGQIRDQIPSICDNKDVLKQVQKGACAHGVGHAVTYLANYNIEQALSLCDLFKDDLLTYYCATGVYMERNLVRGNQDLNAGVYFPCSRYRFPAACFRYKMFKKFNDQQLQEAVLYCKQLSDPNIKHGCFHGIGFRFYKNIEENPSIINEICYRDDGESKRLCIEGAIGVMSVFDKAKSSAVCEQIISEDKKICTDAVETSNFGLSREMFSYE